LATSKPSSILKLQNAVVEALEDIKARDIVVLKVEHLSSMFDRVIIATAESTRQVNALANNVQVKLKELGAKVHGIEGTAGGEWALVDLGDIVVHVMQPAARALYNLEELWDHPAAKARSAAPKAPAKPKVTKSKPARPAQPARPTRPTRPTTAAAAKKRSAPPKKASPRRK
jgi:ribosome-associated protein